MFLATSSSFGHRFSPIRLVFCYCLVSKCNWFWCGPFSFEAYYWVRRLESSMCQWTKSLQLYPAVLRLIPCPELLELSETSVQSSSHIIWYAGSWPTPLVNHRRIRLTDLPHDSLVDHLRLLITNSLEHRVTVVICAGVSDSRRIGFSVTAEMVYNAICFLCLPSVTQLLSEVHYTVFFYSTCLRNARLVLCYLHQMTSHPARDCMLIPYWTQMSCPSQKCMFLHL